MPAPSRSVYQRGELRTVRLRSLGWSTRVNIRAVTITVVMLLATFVVFCWSLAVGDFNVPIPSVIAALFGHGDSSTSFVINTLRLPRALTALLTGACLGMAGAIFQRVARNPLASPDIIGVNAGAAAAAIFVVVVVHGASTQVAAAAFVGATVTALAVYLLAYKRGITGYRLVLVGIAATAALNAVIHYYLSRADIYLAAQAAMWLTGSVAGAGWDQVRNTGFALFVLLPAAALLARHLRLLELGDDTARSLGVRVERTRAGLLLVGVALAAISTAAVGPVGFVALVAPQIARRLVGGRALGLLPAGACGGALLLSASDLVGRRVIAPTELPVGVITAMLGAPYLLYLLARANRIGVGG